MPLARVQISQDKAEIVKALRAKEDGTGLFLTYADVLTFAASLGFQHKKRVPLGKFSRKDPDAVLQEQFRDRSVIDLIAVAETNNPKILSPDPETDLQRVEIFQEYANGGLEILSKELYGIKEPLERTLLILYAEKRRKQPDEEDFDLDQLF
ncbi:DNA phosphorothioation-associated protein 4 [Leptolyngbya sp. FACHB-16]|uniref:DNA phosphorothioation-associated protein 4 n=1 Tax=unclassified Leptolyngbya TaxID=2650499 RepID=UPI001686320F|nr:DNA phosphorothioation-associated protein 4 [Leptolyngbya sp. FACHB-16]MBD2156150.1 DNA phosphorothioation-associated protein 4 [Leptolyngbya sp. FACHB-16]